MNTAIKPPPYVLRCHNDFCDIPFVDMTPTDSNLFMTVCYLYQQLFWTEFHTNIMGKAAERFREENGDIPFKREELFSYIKQDDIPQVELTFKQIKKISNYRTGSYKRMANDIRRTNKKLLRLNSTMEYVDENNNRDTEQFPLFHTFLTKETTKTLSVAIDYRFARMVFEVEKPYTDNEIMEYVNLHRIHSKHMYRQLQKWRRTGKWIVSISEFKRLCCISNAYSYKNMKNKIIKPAIKELQDCFPGLEYHPLTKYHRGKPVDMLEFTYKPRKAGYRKTKYKCPVCGQPLFEKEINGVVQWCHKDGWQKNAPCRLRFNSVAEILGIPETPQRKEPEPEENEEVNKENQEKIRRLSTSFIQEI